MAARRVGAGNVDTTAPRPAGLLLWAHFCPGTTPSGTALVLRDLARRYPGLTMIASGAVDDIPGLAQVVECPPDTRAAARAFLGHWSPDLIVFSGPDAHPILWSEALSHGAQLFAVEADPARHPIALVRAFERFALVHAAAADPRLGQIVHPMAPLAIVPPPPAAIDSDLADLTGLLATRPVWLAASTPDSEVDLVLAAHKHASQLSHRLLLILEIRDAAGGPALRDRLEGADIQAALRSDGEEPYPDTQVYLADDPGEIGLWARLASVTYLGGSMSDGAECDPMIPAGLGSVVMHGPQPGRWQAGLGALDDAGGAWQVNDANALGPAIEHFLLPDRAARIAHQAWDVVTRGAESSNLALAALDSAVRARLAP